eukprot:3587726-Amphidinium_carterae.2
MFSTVSLWKSTYSYRPPKRVEQLELLGTRRFFPGTDSTLTVDNTSVVIISKTAKFRELSKDDLQKYLSKLEPSTEDS